MSHILIVNLQLCAKFPKIQQCVCVCVKYGEYYYLIIITMLFCHIFCIGGMFKFMIKSTIAANDGFLFRTLQTLLTNYYYFFGEFSKHLFDF